VVLLAGGCSQSSTSERQPELATTAAQAATASADARRDFPPATGPQSSDTHFERPMLPHPTATIAAPPSPRDGARPIESPARSAPTAAPPAPAPPPPVVVTRPAPSPPPPAPAQEKPPAKRLEEIEPPRGPQLSDLTIAALIVKASRASYSGNCACPDNVDRAGRRCGGRSAYSRPGGRSPLCFERDVPVGMIADWRRRNR
jgi:hypothetical protein